MKCFNGGNKHKFQPRYDEVPSGYEIDTAKCSSEGVRTLLIREIYVKDICIWCGKEIKK